MGYLLLCLRNPVFRRFGTVPAYDRQANRWTDRRTHDDSIYRASIASCVKIRFERSEQLWFPFM